MFKSGRWRSEKNRVKVVFKLQFHAAQLTQVGSDALVVSVVPVDAGKATVKSEKATVRDGSCFWDSPVYESVKFNRDSKSGKIQEKIYYFVVGTGSSKSGVIGEASLDFSVYAEATKVSLVSLPLKNSKTEAVLNVSIQRMHEATDQRDVGEQDDAKESPRDNSLRSRLGHVDSDELTRNTSFDNVPFNKTVAAVTDLNGNRQASIGSDITITSSENSSGIETPWEEPHIKNVNVPLVPSADDSSGTPGEAFLIHDPEEASETTEKLRNEISALSRQADMSELELQTLRKQIVKESKRSQDLLKEVVSLKGERDTLKAEFEKRAKNQSVISFHEEDSNTIVEELRQELNHVKEINSNLQVQLQKTQESNSELILAVRDLDEVLEKKNKEILGASNGLFKDVKDDKSGEVVFMCQSDDEEQSALEELVKNHTNGKEAYLLEQQLMDLHSELEIYKRDKDELETQMEQLALDYEIVKQKNHEMSYKLEQSELQEQLKMQYECSSTYNVNELENQIENLENELKIRSKESEDLVVTINELESHVKSLEEELEKQTQGFEADLESLTRSKVEHENQIENLENELKIRSKESEDSVVTIHELESHVKSLEEELEKQTQGFEADLESLTRSKVEHEQRAIRAEEALRKTRWQNANTAERLQEEFRRLSVQMTSTFAANEKLTAKALSEASELRYEKGRLEELLRKSSEEFESLKDHYEARLSQISSQVSLMTEQIKELQLELEMHIAKNKILSEEVAGKETLIHELSQMKVSIKEMELLIELGNEERIGLENRVSAVKNEAEVSNVELNRLRSVLKEKELMVGNLTEEMKSCQYEFTELKNSLLEKIKLLEGHLKVKEAYMKKSTDRFLEKEKGLRNKIEELEGKLEANQSSTSDRECDVKMQVDSVPALLACGDNGSLEAQKDSTNQNGDLDELMKEMALLKEGNTSMETELKEMQEKYSEISLMFAEVEGERQELVMKLRNLQNSKKSP